MRQSKLIWKLNNKCWYPSIIICIPRNIEPVQKLSMIWSKLYQLSILCAPLFYVWTYHLNHSPVQILALVTRFQIIDIIWVIIIVVETLRLHASVVPNIIELWTWPIEQGYHGYGKIMHWWSKVDIIDQNVPVDM